MANDGAHLHGWRGRETHGNRRKAAEMLAIGERTMYRKLKEYGLEE
jgi:DNA-binding NtrC family response regulator